MPVTLVQVEETSSIKTRRLVTISAENKPRVDFITFTIITPFGNFSQQIPAIATTDIGNDTFYQVYQIDVNKLLCEYNYLAAICENDTPPTFQLPEISVLPSSLAVGEYPTNYEIYDNLGNFMGDGALPDWSGIGFVSPCPKGISEHQNRIAPTIDGCIPSGIRNFLIPFQAEPYTVVGVGAANQTTPSTTQNVANGLYGVINLVTISQPLQPNTERRFKFYFGNDNQLIEFKTCPTSCEGKSAVLHFKNACCQFQSLVCNCIKLETITERTTNEIGTYQRAGEIYNPASTGFKNCNTYIRHRVTFTIYPTKDNLSSVNYISSTTELYLEYMSALWAGFSTVQARLVSENFPTEICNNFNEVTLVFETGKMPIGC